MKKCNLYGPMRRNLLRGASAIVAIGMPIAAGAAPGLMDQSREAYRTADVFGCESYNDGYRCTEMGVTESYDLKGNFEVASVLLYEEKLDSSAYSFRFAQCPIARGALQLQKAGPQAQFAATVDASTCEFNDGVAIDFSTGEEQPYGFSGALDLSGEWHDPVGSNTAQSNGQSKSPGERFNYACHSAEGSGHQAVAATLNGEALAMGSSFVAYSNCNILNKMY